MCQYDPVFPLDTQSRQGVQLHICPLSKGHLQQEDVRALYAQGIQIALLRQFEEKCHLSSQKDLWHALLQLPGKLLIRGCPTLDKRIKPAVPAIKMRRGHADVHALCTHFTQHGKTHLHVPAAIVDARQNVAVKIDHSAALHTRPSFLFSPPSVYRGHRGTGSAGSPARLL